MHEPIFLWDFTNVTVHAEFNLVEGSIIILSKEDAIEFTKVKYPKTKRANGAFFKMGRKLACFYGYQSQLYFYFDKHLVELNEDINTEIKLARKSTPFIFRMRKNRFALTKTTQEGNKKIIIEVKYKPEKRHWIELLDFTWEYHAEAYDFFLWVNNVLADPERREIMKNPPANVISP